MLQRREFFNWGVRGIGATAFTSLLVNDRARAATAGLLPHYAPKAKRAIHICLVGGLSHVDSFDPKPELTKNHGKAANLSENLIFSSARSGPCAVLTGSSSPGAGAGS